MSETNERQLERLVRGWLFDQHQWGRDLTRQSQQAAIDAALTTFRTGGTYFEAFAAARENI